MSSAKDEPVEAWGGPEVLVDRVLADLALLPALLRNFVVLRYGLDGHPPRSPAALRRAFGLDPSRVRGWETSVLRTLRVRPNH